MKNTIISHILIILGLTLISAGLVTYLAQNWYDLTFTTKLVCTLGFGLVTYCGSLYCYKKNNYYIGDVLLIISAIAIYFGLGTLFEVVHSAYEPYRLNVILGIVQFATLTGLCIIAWIVGSSVMSVIGTVINVHALCFDIIDLPIIAQRFTQLEIIYWYASLILFTIFLVLGYVLQNRSPRAYLLRLIGSIGAGFATFRLGNWGISWFDHSAHDAYSTWWKVTLPLLGLVYLIAGVTRRDQALIIGGMCTLIGTIYVITFTYGRQMVGLPIALSLSGVICIALSYSTVILSKRYSQK